jgi:hypothetical protein
MIGGAGKKTQNKATVEKDRWGGEKKAKNEANRERRNMSSDEDLN